MKNLVFACSVMALCIGIASSKAQTVNWAKSVGGGQYDHNDFIGIDNAGNVYTVGTFKGQVDFDPGTGTFNLNDANGNIYTVLYKLNASGEFVWANKLATGCRGMTVDSDGNLYLIGSYEASTDIDPSSGSFFLPNYGGCVYKLTSDCNLVWAHEIDPYSSSTLDLRALAIDTQGNVYVTGGFEGTIDVGLGTGTNTLSNENDFDPSDKDIFVAKYSTTGSYVWAAQFSGTNVNRGQGNSIAVDPSGNIYTLGVFISNVDFDPSNGVANLNAGPDVKYDVFVSKLDNSGNFLWAKSIDGASPNDMFAEYISTDASGNIYFAGMFSAVVDFDPNGGVFSLNATIGNDPFLCKLDPNGNFVWAKQLQSTESHPYGLVGAYKVDSDGNFYISSDFFDDLTLDPTRTIINSDGPVYTCKFNSDGNLLWVDQYGNGGNTDVYSITVDQSGNLYAGGLFYSTTDFAPGPSVVNLTSNFNADAFILKRGQGIVGVVESPANSFKIYPNPAFDVLNIEAMGDYNVKIYTMQGQLIQTHTANYPTRLDVSGLVQGVYMAAIENGTGVSRMSFIKQ
ncbi:MAG: SBBP repeat-containing protein [Sphingobacteriales bacterium JAD_PAG50586_3]|nr:MAG: SBBP repeat-containing protein [Sphingobacteriales bacterium JAD_PAG50586_3]